MRDVVHRAGPLVGLLCLLSACSSGAGPAPEETREVAALHREWIDRDLAATDSALVREVLADHWVTDAELAEAQDDYRECLEGWPTDLDVTFDEDGGTSVGPVPDGPGEAEEFDAFTTGCQDRAYATVSMYHGELRANPQGLTYAEAVRACFDEHGVPDGKELSADEFERLVLGTEGGPAYEPASPEAEQCVRDPFPGGA
ncbi:hypothetical protein ACFUMH_00095 [Cellulomonas sp. NPDC057328]|uniref:hypothetical protein n=1 Tax=Cellulomonas sp. NPDC057328 TaxID=3346101 RepID=UPI0036459FCE